MKRGLITSKRTRILFTNEGRFSDFTLLVVWLNVNIPPYGWH